MNAGGKAVTRRSDNIRHPRKRAFLTAYAETGNVTQAAETAGIHRDTHYAWLESDQGYPAAFATAGEAAADRLEAEARRRAVEGVEQPVWYHGMQVGSARRYSDRLLMFLLRGVRPERYQVQRHDVTHRATLEPHKQGEVTQRMLEDPEIMNLALTLEERLAGLPG